MIEVNEYVRTKKGSIDKVINPNYYMSIYVECEKGMYLLDNVVKHSKQLIDLIKVGDIVNSCIVVGFGYECVNGPIIKIALNKIQEIVYILKCL